MDEIKLNINLNFNETVPFNILYLIAYKYNNINDEQQLFNKIVFGANTYIIKKEILYYLLYKENCNEDNENTVTKYKFDKLKNKYNIELNHKEYKDYLFKTLRKDCCAENRYCSIELESITCYDIISNRVYKITYEIEDKIEDKEE